MKQGRDVGSDDTPIFFDGSGKRWLYTRIILTTVSVIVFLSIIWTVPLVVADRRVPSLDVPSVQMNTNFQSSVLVTQLSMLAKTRTDNDTAVIGTGPELQLTQVVVDHSGCYIVNPITHQKIRPLTYAEVLYIGDGEYVYLRYGDANKIMPTVDQLANTVSRVNTAVFGQGPLIRLVEIVKKDDTAMFAADPFNGGIYQRISDDDVTYLNGDRYALQRYGQTDGKRIALTFDDGPDPVYTPPLLDLLSKESAQASFFAIGTNVAKYPEIANRVVREGHTIANHTFSHVDFDYVSAAESVQQINQAQRIIVAATQSNTPFYRSPYGGDTEQSLRNSMRSILNAQKLGYVVTSYDFDSNDWKFSSGYKPVMPQLDGKDKVVLVHDSGGDRSHTLKYVQDLITKAKAQGYTFVSLAQMYPQLLPYTLKTQPEFADQVTLAVTQASMVWPLYAVRFLFGFSVVMIAFTTIMNVTLAIINVIKNKRKKWNVRYKPLVTVIVPAYNEGVVIVNSVRSLLQSKYRKLEVVIVDDGSTDDTWEIAARLEDRYKRVRAIHQPNSGKASALNNAIAHAKGEVVICVDADTIFSPQTIGNLVRHFSDTSVAAVAGVIKVGNVGNMLTRWQMLEYTVSIAIDRNAHSLINSIMIIPGACGAWRKSVVEAAGGFSHSTLAEDCDLTIKIQQSNKYKIVQENDAISYTEAPDFIAALTKQRFRWMFGNIQSLWKHRSMLFNYRYRWLGMFIMPNALISIMIPLLFWPLLAYISIQNILAGNYQVILLYFMISMTIQFIVALIGVRLAHERMALLWAVPFARFIYGPIRLYILYKTVITALRGSYVGWNKLMRVGSATYPMGSKQSVVLPVDVSKISSVRP